MRINLYNRNNNPTYLKKRGDGKWALKGKFDYMRYGHLNEGEATDLFFVDPPGGPFMGINSIIKDKTSNKFFKVKSIEIVKKDTLLELEEVPNDLG